jgi:hypothetical protein
MVDAEEVNHLKVSGSLWKLSSWPKVTLRQMRPRGMASFLGTIP